MTAVAVQASEAAAENLPEGQFDVLADQLFKKLELVMDKRAGDWKKKFLVHTHEHGTFEHPGTVKVLELMAQRLAQLTEQLQVMEERMQLAEATAEAALNQRPRRS